MYFLRAVCLVMDITMTMTIIIDHLRHAIINTDRHHHLIITMIIIIQKIITMAIDHLLRDNIMKRSVLPSVIMMSIDSLEIITTDMVMMIIGEDHVGMASGNLICQKYFSI